MFVLLAFCWLESTLTPPRWRSWDFGITWCALATSPSQAQAHCSCRPWACSAAPGHAPPKCCPWARRGHCTSRDMVRWVRLPPALQPTPTGLDSLGARPRLPPASCHPPSTPLGRTRLPPRGARPSQRRSCACAFVPAPPLVPTGRERLRPAFIAARLPHAGCFSGSCFCGSKGPVIMFTAVRPRPELCRRLAATSPALPAELMPPASPRSSCTLPRPPSWTTQEAPAEAGRARSSGAAPPGCSSPRAEECNGYDDECAAALCDQPFIEAQCYATPLPSPPRAGGALSLAVRRWQRSVALLLAASRGGKSQEEREERHLRAWVKAEGATLPAPPRHLSAHLRGWRAHNPQRVEGETNPKAASRVAQADARAC